MAGLTYKSASARVEDLASGRTVEPGEVVTFTKDEASDPHNKRLIDEGVFIEADDGKSKPKNEEGGS